MKKSPWFTIYRCINCDKALSYEKKMYSNGRCYHCGFKHPDACTIVETKEYAARKVWPKWWKFWDWYLEVK